jgi:hypothetical protein
MTPTAADRTAMRRVASRDRFRNPRYAPESLERRLSPSFLGAVPASPALVMTLPDEPCPYPSPEPDLPPLPPISVPGPVGPMATV